MTTLELIPLRYETPTATLTVTAQSLAISQWSERPVVQPWRFQLAVTPSDRDRPLEITGKQADLITLKTLLQDYQQGILTQGAQPVMASGIALQPEGITQHRLTLGPLSSSPFVESLTLSTLELADWVDLFEQVEAQVRPLPMPLTPTRRLRSWRQWSSLAAVLIVSVGTVAVWPYLNRNQPLPTASPALIEDAELESSASADSLGERSVTAPEPAIADSQPEDLVPAPAETSPAAAEASTPDPPRPKTTASPEPQSQQTDAPPEKPRQQVPPPAPSASTEAPEVTTSPTGGNQGSTAARAPSSGTALSPPTDRPENITDADDGLTAESTPVTGETSPFGFEDSPVLPREWQPPTGFTGVLTYRITLTTEGHISAIAPENERSTVYQHLTGLPGIGTTLEATHLGEALIIRFYDDGTVEVSPAPESP